MTGHWKNYSYFNETFLVRGLFFISLNDHFGYPLLGLADFYYDAGFRN